MVGLISLANPFSQYFHLSQHGGAEAQSPAKSGILSDACTALVATRIWSMPPVRHLEETPSGIVVLTKKTGKTGKGGFETRAHE